MMHSLPQSAAPVPHVSSLLPAGALTPAPRKAPAPLPFLPRGAKPAPRPPRPTFKTRRVEVTWLDDAGLIQSASRSAPALPQFEEAFGAIARGTLIETESGLIAIEDMEPGQRVATADGRGATVLWIGAMTVYPSGSVPGLESAPLTRVTGDAFGEGRPMPDLMLGPNARLALSGGRWARGGSNRTSVPASALVDGEAIVAIHPVAPVTVYHVVLCHHATIACAGIEVESFHPGRDFAAKIDIELQAMFVALFPMFQGLADFGPLAHARLSLDEAQEVLAA